MTRRTRALAMLGLAAVCAGLAASIVTGYARSVRAQVGPAVPVLMARQPVPRGKLLTPANVPRYLASRKVPLRFVPARTVRDVRDAVGLRPLVTIPAGSYVSAAQLGRSADDPDGDRSQNALGRIVEVQVTGAAAMDGALHPGARVDVLITSERGSATPQTYLAIQGIELVDFRTDTSSSDSPGEPDARAFLRVSLRQAVLLTAAQNFARELRLLPRAPGDSRRLPPTAVGAADLHP